MKRIDVITYYGPICEYGVSKLIEITLMALSHRTTAIHLRIDSQGGDLYAAFTAYEHLRALDTHLITHNLNNVRGDALLPYLAADIRTASPDATFWLTTEELPSFFGTSSLDNGTAMLRLGFIDLDYKRFMKIFDARTQHGFDVRHCSACDEPGDSFCSHWTRLGITEAMTAGIILS